MIGIGKLLLPDGTLIQSDFINGQINGKTRIIKFNGEYFDGKTGVHGLSEGTVYENGIIYQGKMLNNKPHGKGKEITGEYEFEGIFEEGKKIKGKLKWNK